MAPEVYVIDDPSILTAGAEGVPGQRTFYIIAGKDGIWVRMWLEKEQLRALGIAIEQVLTELQQYGSATGEVEESAAETASLPEPPTAEFRVGSISLAYDQAQALMLLLIHDEETDPQGSPTLACQATISQANALSQRIAKVVAAGRPLCPLCGRSMDASGHRCPRSNGHDA